MRRFTYLFFVGIMVIFSAGNMVAQEVMQGSPIQKQEISGFKNTKLTKGILRNGILLDSIQLNTSRDPQGVTVVNDTIIIVSSDGAGNNYFDTYDFAGNHYREVVEATTSKWGYRDLAFDGQYILASDDSTIKKISPQTFAVVSFITNAENNPHRGLAYDSGENVIYSTNWGTGGHLLKINATTGATLKDYGCPTGSPYGIAFDPYTNSGRASLWFTHNKSFSTDPFMLQRVDTTNANVNYIFDFNGQIPDSCKEGGLEIVNSPVAYPNKVVALATDQKYHKLYFIDITNAGTVLPAKLEVTDEFEGWETAGATRGIVAPYPYLYAIESGNLALYNLSSSPGQPVFVKTDSAIGHRTAGYGGNKIFKYGNKLFITVTGPYPTGNKDDFTTIESYSIADPANPEYLNKVDVNLPIKHAAFYGHYIFLTHADKANVFSVVKWYDDGTMELLHQYQLTGSQGEPAYPMDIQIDELYNLMFLSYHYTNSGGYPKTAVLVYNILNVNALKLLSSKSLSGNYPTALQILPDRRLAVLVNKEYHSTSSSVYCYEYSDLANLNFLGLKIVSSTHIAFDLKMLSDNLLAVSVPDENIKTYYWDDQSTTFLAGPEAALDEGADIIPYAVPVASTTIKSSMAPMPANMQYFFAMLRGYAPEFGHVVTGSEKTGIIKVVKQPKTEHQTLTMSIMPPEASQYGCSVTPSPGAHRYAKGTTINVYAHPSPDEGWYFTGWTGSVSGKDLIKHVVMDADKIAVAHFAKLELTVSGKVGSAWYCPRKIEEDTSLMELPFLVCVSDADDWELSKISFRHSGTGDAFMDIAHVVLQKGGTTVFTGRFWDNTMDVTFNPPIVIMAGQCVPFKLIYHFGFTPDGGAPPANTIPYASDEVKTFHVETFGVVATPLTLEGGIIAGKAHNDTLTFARVRNSQGYLFPKIKDAVNAKTTRSGDTCSVCGGYYTESIQLIDTTKALTLLSYDGSEKTVLYPDSNTLSYPFIMLLSGHAPKTVEGFSMYCDSCTGIALRHAHKSLIKNNIMYTQVGVALYDTKTSKVESNFFRTKNEAVTLFKSQENEVFDNTMGDISADMSTLSLWKSDRNNLHDNNLSRIKSKKTGFWIKAVKSSQNKISGHSFPENYTGTHLIQIKDGSIGNEIFDNTNFIVEVSEYSDSTNIYQNSLERVSIKRYSSTGTRIESNTISGSEENGIDLTYSFIKGMVFIKNNDISGHTGYGIYSDGVKTMIYGNEIYHNGYDPEHGVKKSGVNLENNRGSNLVRNRIYGNMGDGVSLNNSRDILIQHNEISAHNTHATGGDNTSAGISIYYSPSVYAGKIYIQDNYLAKNCTGITIYSAGENNEPDVYMKGNTIENSFCLNTGIHVNHGVLRLTGNNVRNNNGNGILLQNGSIPTMTHNNISGNSEYGLNNQTADKVTAPSNYWGNSDGPGTGGVFGNVDYDNWMTTPVTLVAFPNSDTVYASPGTTDSTSLHIQNLNNLTDNLLVSIHEGKGWVHAVQNRQIALKDSMGWLFSFKYTIPAGTSPDESEKVYYKVSSATEQSIDSGWFVLTVYKPVPETIQLNREKATVMFDDSLQFHAFVFDQYDHQLEIPLQWQASSGVVSDSGLFVAGNTEGDARITVSDTSGKVTGTAHVYISNQKAVLTRIVVSPDTAVLKPYGRTKFSVKGYDQFGYPMCSEKQWGASDTAVAVDHNGVCLAKAYPGTYYVIVRDVDSTQSDTAVVIIENVTGVEQTNAVSSGINLSQNYPNPFHNRTHIRFILPKPANIWLSVFDINGREVIRLLKAWKPAGTYRLTFDAAHLPAGIYFYKLQAGGHVQMKKMVVVR